MGKYLAAIAVFMLLFTAPSSAEEFRQHAFGFSPEVYRVIYEEPHFAKNQGVMYGGTLSYSYHNTLMFRIEGRAALGYVDYSSEGTGSIRNLYDYVIEPRVLIGYDFPTEDNTIYTLYTGFGYRYLNDNSSGKVSTTGAVGYERESNYFYSPIGIQGLTNWDNNWSMAVILEYDLLWSGGQISHLGDADPTLNTVHNNQNRGYGLRGSLNILKKSEAYDLSLEPFIRYWHIDSSEISGIEQQGRGLVDLGQEPKNRTTEIGVDASILF